MSKILRLIFIPLLVFPAFAVTAEAVYIEDTGFVLEPPVGWTVLDVTDSRWTFQDFTGEAFMQIKIWPGDSWDSGQAVFDGVTGELAAKAEGEQYDLYGRDAVFGILDFASGGYEYSGYGLFTDGEDFDMAILSFASAEALPLLNDYVLSALDSFAFAPGLMLNPGPVSSYYLQSYTASQRIPASTVFEGEAVEWQVDGRAVEASQLVIEREAAILGDFKPDTEEGIEAWKRYYRLIYRDNYSRLDYPAALLKERLLQTEELDDTDESGSDTEDSSGSWFSSGSEKRRQSLRSSASKLSLDAPQRLLSWVQGFNYRRTGGSDLISPLAAAAFGDGDCDSRSLLYIILLNHYGVDSALMVSAVYSHAMAAVDTEGPGARINIDGRMLLVAETTDDVAIGMIASDMADPAKWTVISLMEKEPWN
ncbi:MAG: hypothetical protein PQJ61_11735 [Spirochaetales bacterium]|uniref:Transglutaminase-like domain-containing protein n=1 Tax=Candidatus Thalassospirochaeta sargassi TaxID=3119039 RepID=A0AAJ1IFX5_9SPIO|nr:hypothetical protein [Spirochaetales bacterium]